ncbi:MAG: preprotein translocase subunit SecE [bacterium]|nr:preprotein translocase subunit SecE [bacterium]
MGPAQFLREVRGELRKVSWPRREEVVNYSIVVLVVLVLLTAAIGLLDWGFSEAILKLFDR